MCLNQIYMLIHLQSITRKQLLWRYLMNLHFHFLGKGTTLKRNLVFPFCFFWIKKVFYRPRSHSQVKQYINALQILIFECYASFSSQKPCPFMNNQSPIDALLRWIKGYIQMHSSITLLRVWQIIFCFIQNDVLTVIINWRNCTIKHIEHHLSYLRISTNLFYLDKDTLKSYINTRKISFISWM